MPHPGPDSARQVEGFIFAGDALLEFAAEPILMHAGSPSRPRDPTVSACDAREVWQCPSARIHAPRPKVISPLVAFVLGFVLATSMAWLDSDPFGSRASRLAMDDTLSGVEPVLAASSAPILVAPAIVQCLAWWPRREGLEDTSPSSAVEPPQSRHPARTKASR